MKNLLIIASLYCLAVSQPTLAQEALTGENVDSTESLIQSREAEQGPRVGKHLFSPLAGVGFPAIRTVTTANLGAGVSTGVKIPIVEVNGKPVSANIGSLAVLTVKARHEQAIKPWMSFYAEYGITGRLGTNITSLLAQGINTSIGFDLGWKVKIIEDDAWSIVTGLGLRDASYVNIDAKAWAEGIIDSGGIVESSQLFDTKPALRVTWTGGAAHSFSRMFGLYGGLSVGLEEPKQRGGDYRVTIDALLALSVDWNDLTEVPIGTTLGLEYKENPDIAGADDGSHKNIYFRLGYTGQDEFGLGLQMQYQFVPIGGITDQVTFITGLLDMRFYF